MSAFKWILVFILVIGSLTLAFALVDARGGIERQRGEVDLAWAELERDFLERRRLLPKLIEGIRSSTLETRQPVLEQAMLKVAKRMARMDEASNRLEMIEANLNLEQATDSLMSALNSFPALHDDPHLSSPRDEVLALANQIDVDRTEYNEAVQRFNVHLALFPRNLAAKVFGFERQAEYVPTTLMPKQMPRGIPRGDESPGAGDE